MPCTLHTQRLHLVPVEAGDADRLCSLLCQPEVRRYLCDDTEVPRSDVAAWIADSLDLSSITTFWRIATQASDFIGLAGLRPPTTASLALRAIGWRSLELVIAIDSQSWRRGLASEAVEAVCELAGRDGVTFALVASVDEPNERSHALMRRCNFQLLGRAAGRIHPLLVYERAV